MTLAQRRAHLAVWLVLGCLLTLGLLWAWSIRPPIALPTAPAPDAETRP
jgi:hypothetical protein